MLSLLVGMVSAETCVGHGRHTSYATQALAVDQNLLQCEIITLAMRQYNAKAFIASDKRIHYWRQMCLMLVTNAFCNGDEHFGQA